MFVLPVHNVQRRTCAEPLTRLHNMSQILNNVIYKLEHFASISYRKIVDKKMYSKK